MALVSILCIAALMETAVLIIDGARTAQLRLIRVRAQNPGEKRP
jgi:hypothetical protein